MDDFLYSFYKHEPNPTRSCIMALIASHALISNTAQFWMTRNVASTWAQPTSEHNKGKEPRATPSLVQKRQCVNNQNSPKNRFSMRLSLVFFFYLMLKHLLRLKWFLSALIFYAHFTVFGNSMHRHLWRLTRKHLNDFNDVILQSIIAWISKRTIQANN